MRCEGRWFGYALTPRALLMLVAGCLLAIPGFFYPQWIFAMLAWDALVLLLAVLDGARLPVPSSIEIERRFDQSPILGEPTQVTLEVTQNSNSILDIRITDALHPSLEPMPATHRVLAYPRDTVRATFSCTPNTRGDVTLGRVFLRYRGALKLVERWAEANLEAQVRVHPPMERSPENSSLFLLRIRQIALQKRRLRLRGLGREFESLREYQTGDEMRNISWSATARRSRIITREFTTERSQQVWVVIDAGRLSRTAFELRHKNTVAAEASFPTRARFQDTVIENDVALTVTQLDQATGAAVALAQAVMQTGDKAALLVYGRKVQQQLLPAAGAGHLRRFVDALSLVRAEGSEANHLSAAARLKNLQRRRGLILWITELADSAQRPEIVDAAADLARRHLVVLVVLGHPELDELAKHEPHNVEQMFYSTAATEVIERRREVLARLRAQGVLVVETTPGSVKADAVNQYLEVKAQGTL